MGPKKLAGYHRDFSKEYQTVITLPDIELRLANYDGPAIADRTVDAPGGGRDDFARTRSCRACA